MEIKDFTYTLPDKRQLYDHLNAHFEDDKVNILLGPNGVGKTTLLDFISTVKSRDPSFFEGFPAFKQIAYQIQGVPFIYEATVYNTIKMVMDIQTPNNRFTKADLPDVLQKVADVKYGKLSGGQRQLVIIDAFSRLNRQLYLFDEPESGLDPRMAQVVMQRIQQLNSEGKKIILTSHQFQNINNDHYHLLFLKDGKIRFEGSPSEFLKREGTSDLVQAYIKTDEDQ